MSKLLRSSNLGVKLNIYLLFVLGVFLLSIVFLLNRNTQSLTERVGNERVLEEVTALENRLAEVEDKLQVDINFLATGVYFVQAVGSRNESNIAEIITTANESLRLDDISVVDGDGKRLIDTAIEQDTTAEDNLLAIGLSGKEACTLLIEHNGDTIQVSIAAVAPIVNTTGNVLGAIQMSRLINDNFLADLTFGREAVHLGLIYDKQIIARTRVNETDAHSLSDNMLANGITIDRTALRTAQSGQVVIPHSLISGDKGVPHAVAYTPVLASTDDIPVAVMILIELEELYSFQKSTLNNTVFIFTALAMLAVSTIYVTINQTTIRPLNELKAIAQTMTSGQYDERAPVKSQDEVGQLAVAFNEMANAIQQREISLKAAREQAERADRAKSMFLASVSHELRTPLNAIINLTKFVALGMYGDINEEQKERLYQVEGSGKHLLNLINDVLDISKIEAGSLELFVEEGLHIDDIIESVVQTAKGLLLERPIAIHTEIEPNLPLLTGDEQRIRQIVLNLFSNACKFTEEGSITVKVYRQERELLIAVKDTGPGIDPKYHDSIFEVFRQAKVRGRKAEGTGLGLPISRRLAEAHGGRLWVKSALGEGATFYVALPIKSTLVPTV